MAGSTFCLVRPPDAPGGQKKLNGGLFDPEKGSVAKIEADAGVSTAA